jgi:hypothetical protein
MIERPIFSDDYDDVLDWAPPVVVFVCFRFIRPAALTS